MSGLPWVFLIGHYCLRLMTRRHEIVASPDCHDNARREDEIWQALGQLRYLCSDMAAGRSEFIGTGHR